MTSPEIGQIVDFVEGRLEAKEFEKLLYENPRFEEVLNDAPHMPLNAYIGNSVYLYVIQQNFNTSHGVLNVHGALSEFLQKHGYDVSPTQAFEDNFKFLLEAQPLWLSVDLSYIQDNILPAAGGLAGEELKKWLGAELLKRFIYIADPPSWIQNPQWPIGTDGPLTFLGQLPHRQLLSRRSRCLCLS